MMIHERVADSRGIGKWDLGTTRYIPMQGGSRSRLPLQDDPNYPRYVGFVGLDERMSEHLYTIPALYSYLGGSPEVPEGGSSFTALVLNETRAKLMVEKEEGEEKHLAASSARR